MRIKTAFLPVNVGWETPSSHFVKRTGSGFSSLQPGSDTVKCTTVIITRPEVSIQNKIRAWQDCRPYYKAFFLMQFRFQSYIISLELTSRSTAYQSTQWPYVWSLVLVLCLEILSTEENIWLKLKLFILFHFLSFLFLSPQNVRNVKCFFFFLNLWEHLLTLLFPYNFFIIIMIILFTCFRFPLSSCIM